MLGYHDFLVLKGGGTRPMRPQSTPPMRTKTVAQRTIMARPNWTYTLPALSREEIRAEKLHRRRRLEQVTGQRYVPPMPEPYTQLGWELRYHSRAAELRQRRIIEVDRRARSPAPVIGGPEAAQREADIRRGVSWSQRGPH
jgi:hypothetical protein